MQIRETRKPSKEILVILAENLRRFRKDKNISQEKMAELCGLHRTYIGSIERCERNVTLSTLEIFAKILEITVPDLLIKQLNNFNEKVNNK